MRLTLESTLLVLLMCLGNGSAHAERQAPPQIVADARALTSQDASSPDLSAQPGLYRSIDVTGDGRPDWIVDFMKAQSGYYCGTGGCPLKVWVFEPKDSSWRLEMDGQGLGYSLPRKGAIRRQMHGAYCGKTGSEECHLDFVWDEAIGRFIEKPGKDGESMPIWSPRPVREDEMPAAVWSAQAEFSSSCVIKGGAPDVADSVTSIPDIDGDGVRDWVFDGYAAFCSTKDGDQIMPPCTGGECQFEAFVTDSKAEGGARRVYRGGVDWQVAFHKKRPADIMVLPFDADCGGPKKPQCTFQRAAIERAH